MQRREFLATAVACTALSQTLSGGRVAEAREPIARHGAPRFQIGLAAYSLRNYFSFMKGKARKPHQDGPAIDMVGFLDYCTKHNFDAAELTSYFFSPDADERYFLELKRQAFLRGLTISGTAIGNDFTVGKGPKLDRQIKDAIQWIDHAAVLGAPHIRFFAGTKKQLDGHPQRLEEACEAVNHCAQHAAKKGVFLGVENHGKLSADQMLEIMRRVDSPWVGINLDTGNFISNDPYADLERCAPYAVNVQVKVKMRSPDGTEYDADMKRIGKILKSTGYQGFVILEFEEEAPYEHIPAATEELRAALA